MSTFANGVPFTKMHGLGNDYLYIDIRNLEGADTVDWSDLALKMSDRHFGVGSDGIILIAPSSLAEVRMRIFNSDGSESEMCGNGLRALAKWLYDRGETGPKQAVETGAGILHPEIVAEIGGRAAQIRVDMGEPRFTRADLAIAGDPQSRYIGETLAVGDERFELSAVSMGNPHAMIFGPLWDVEQMALWGPRIERHPLFLRRINVHSVEILDENRFAMRHWERGAGLTLACGTGVAAAVVAMGLTGHGRGTFTVSVPGGTLTALWDPENDHVFLEGPAQEVMQGIFQIR